MFQRLGRVFGQGENLEKKSVTLTDPAAFEIFGITPSSTGISVTAQSAMRVPAVRRAVSLIAESVAVLPFKIHDQETRESVKAHPAYALIHDHANDWTSAKAFREQITTDALLHGHGFAQIARNPEGKPLFMLRIAPGAVSIEHDDYGEPSYRVTLAGGGTEILPYSEVLHIQALGGISPVSLARDAIGLAIAAEKHLAGFHKNGGRPSGIILRPAENKSLDAESLKKITTSWFKSHSGENAGGTAILDEGMTYQPLDSKHTDSQFLENRRFQIEEIARAFGVPPSSLFEMGRATWKNYEQAQLDFKVGTLRPWIARWQDAYTRVLIAPEDRDAFYIEGVVDDMLTVDHATRATAFAQYRAAGVMSANDVRSRINMPPLPDGDSLDNPYTSTGAAPAPAASTDENDE